MTSTSIEWREAEPDIKAKEINQLLQEINWFDAFAFIQNALAGIKVYFTKECDQAITTHLVAEPNELGGLLLGRAFRVPFCGAAQYPWITLVEKSVSSDDYRNSAVSLRMGTEVWSRASAHLERGLMIVGWYHSHPNLGVFFSGTDRATQSAFFNQSYALGLVIDPIRKERKCFFGGASEELDSQAMRVF